MIFGNVKHISTRFSVWIRYFFLVELQVIVLKLIKVYKDFV